MARGETRFGSQRNRQVLVGTTLQPTRGGEIGMTRETAQILIAGAQAQNSAQYGIIFTACAMNLNWLNGATHGPVWQVTDVRVRYEVAGTDAGAVTLMLVKVPSGTAKAAGVNCLAAGINLKSTPDTNIDAPLNATIGNYQLVDGDSLAVVPTGTLTALVGVQVMVELKRLHG